MRRLLNSQRPSRRARAAAVVGLAAATAGGTLIAGEAAAEPELRNYVKTIRCNSADPFPGPQLPIRVSVWNKVRFPSDGLPGPAIELIATGPRPGGLPNIGTYTIETRVKWRNVTTGKRGSVFVPTTTNRVTWQAVIHPGRGQVHFTIHQKIGAVAFMPMVNPQFSSCRGSAPSV